MSPRVRQVAAGLAGIVAGAVVIMGVEYLSTLVYPLPEGVDPKDREAMRSVVAGLPAGAFLFVLAAWALGTVAGAYLATRLARTDSRTPALIVGVFFLAGAIMTMMSIPHPIWFWVVAVLLFLPAAEFGRRLAGRPVVAGP